jgi:hypothetical protein
MNSGIEIFSVRTNHLHSGVAGAKSPHPIPDYANCCDIGNFESSIPDRQFESRIPLQESSCRAGQSRLLNRDLALDIVGFESDCLGRPHARQYTQFRLCKLLRHRQFVGLRQIDVAAAD